MANIISIEAGEKGELLCELWAARGNHSILEPTDLDNAAVIVFGGSTPEALSASVQQLAAKIVIDCGHPAAASQLQGSVSRAGLLAQKFPQARVVAAFNAVSADVLRLVARNGAPEIGTVYTSAFYCGDDDEAKRVVAGLMGEINLDPIDCGPLSNAVLLESVGVLGDYLQEHVFTELFAITVVRPPSDRSPLDRWM